MGLDLVDSLGHVIAGIPGAPSRPQQLAKQLTLNKDLASRLVRALRTSDPVQALQVMPGPGPLRRVLSSASGAGVPSQVIDRAATAVAAFDDLIRSEFGARADFDAAISFAHPEARERHESTAKQAAYRGAAGIRGVSVDLMLVTFFVHPSRDDAERLDTAVVNSYLGLRRTRPGAHFEFATYLFDLPLYGQDALPRHEAEELGRSSILRRFCSPQDPPLTVSRDGDKIRYVLTDTGIGQSSAIDIVTHELYPKNHPRAYREGIKPTRWFFATADQPAVVMVFDVFMHRDAWPGIDPSLVIYDTVVKGVADPTDRTRDGDRLDLCEGIEPLGNTAYAARLPEAPKYRDMLEHVCGLHGWDPRAFRGYRTRINYPFHGSQISMIFNPFGVLE
ncbi:MAG: hypothetical protein RBS39_00320 [Phycisphaerales bacterium]|nr:hypothetical protein [Phycisphaerales bacterium]